MMPIDQKRSHFTISQDLDPSRIIAPNFIVELEVKAGLWMILVATPLYFGN
jgi:hypothetical protein